MKIQNVAVILAVVLAIGSTPYGHSHAHGKKHNPVRYQFVMKNGIPDSYVQSANPLMPSSANLEQGAKLYTDNCAVCHGATGKGDGPAAKDSKPPAPALGGMMEMIAGMKRDGRMMKGHRGMSAKQREMSMMTEGYVFWTISEGGEALKTGMPAFKDALSEKERWNIVLFMMNGFKRTLKE